MSHSFSKYARKMRSSESQSPSLSPLSSKARQLPLYGSPNTIRPPPPPFPSDRQLPRYGAPTFVPHRKVAPPSYEDLMKTVDHRYTEAPPRYRSSFALPDIFEDDEIEIEISSVLPSSTSRAESVGNRSRPPRLCAFVRGMLALFTARCSRRRLRAPTPASASVVMDGLD